MHGVHEMQRLRAEHAALTTLAQFLMAMVAAPEPPRPTELASVCGMLRDTLVRHLKCEDWILYPRLIASGDAATVALARAFEAEMGSIASDFAAYDARWSTGRAVAEWPAFRAETTAILDALENRIAREDRYLYPLADALDAAGLPPLPQGALRGGSTVSS